MSMHQLTGFGRKTSSHNPTSSQRRYLHRSPDFRYLEIWRKANAPVNSHFHCLYSYPSLVKQIIQVTTAARIKGFIPFIHAVPASAKVLRKVWGIPNEPQSLSHYLRSPTSRYATRSFKEAKETVPIIHCKAPKPGILSMSYALTSGIEPLETAASWGFRNHFKQEQYFSMVDLLHKFLQEIEINEHSYFEKKGRHLICQYNELEVGDFMVLNIPPEMVEWYVFDSRPYNTPTGRKVTDLVANPEFYAKDLFDGPRTHLASLILSKETLGPNSPISIVCANNPQEVDSFCKGISFRSMSEIEAFEGFVSSSITNIEEDQKAKKKELDAELDSFIERFKKYLENQLSEEEKRFEEIPLFSPNLGYMI